MSSSSSQPHTSSQTRISKSSSSQLQNRDEISRKESFDFNYAENGDEEENEENETNETNEEIR